MSGTITFPPNPTDGQLYTSGGVTWQWHANPGVWVNANTGTNFLALSGGTMTGPITLPGNAASALQAVPLQQVVPIAGGTMTGALTLSGNATQPLQAVPFQQVSSTVALALNDVGRNLIHNALFNIHQRGVGPWTTNISYTADRWNLTYIGDTNSVLVGAISDAGRAAIGDEAALNYLSNTFTGVNAAGNYSLIQQGIENVRRLSNKTVTVSFWATAGAAGLRLGVSFVQIFGDGGSPTAPVTVNGQSIALTTSWARYALTFNIPSASGSIFGTNGNDNTLLRFWYSAGSTFASASGGVGVQSGGITLWGIQCEIASSATQLEKKDPEVDLANCQRFYVAFPTNSILISGYNSTGGLYYNVFTLPTTMRSTPTVTVNSAATGNSSAATVATQSPHAIVLQSTITATGGGWVYCAPAASADF